MPDPKVENWKQKGHLYLWRYRSNLKNYPGWHLHADLTACEALVDLHDMMLASPWPNRKRLTLMPPTSGAVGIPNNHSEWYTASHLTIIHPKDKVSDVHWLLNRQDGSVDLIVGSAKLRELRDGIAGLSSSNDYAIGPEDEDLWREMCLWFW